tara:strand:- start:36 stop:434 length:399 start_codon:yes stop_codon:yes gene_type:complete
MFRFIIVAVFFATLIACRPEDPETIDNVISLLRENGYQIGERSEEQVVYIFAVDGIGIDVNGQHILIYEFADDEIIDDGIEATEKVLQSKTGFWEFNKQPTEEPYHVKGKILLFLGDHPDAGKIRELLDTSL